ncbi:MAG: hypothetical protein V7727_09285 [Sneathiella sp.]
MKNTKRIASFMLVGSFLALGACQTTESGSSAGLDTSSLSSGAKMIANATLSDMSAVKSACQSGKDGVTKLITAKTTSLMQSGESLDPSKDGPEAGAFIGKNCSSLLSA